MRIEIGDPSRVRPSAGVRAALRHGARAALTSRYLPWGAALLAVVLTLPALTVGWVVDDHFHRAAMLGSRAFGDFVDSPMDLFRFLDGDPERTWRMVDRGFLPWWTYTGIKACFWRPLTVLTHWLDYRLWPDSAVLMHLHSLLWFGAAVAAVALLYRRLMGATWIAGAAAVLYAIDDAHGMPVGFLANRNVLLATVFGVWALIVHDRWRRGGWRAGVIFGPLLLALSLLAKEAGIAVCAYLAAYAVFLDHGRWWRRGAVLLPYVVVVVIWRAIWSGLGYGVAEAGFYIDPLGEPWRFVIAVVERLPVLLLGQWAAPPAELSIVLNPRQMVWLWWPAVVFVTLLAVVVWPVLRQDRLARFWALGMILAVIPACATFPADRLLFFVGIGAMGLLAQLLATIFAKSAPRPRTRAWRVPAVSLGVLFLLLHVAVAPAALPLRAAYPVGPKWFDQFYVQVEVDAPIENQDVILVNPPSIMHTAYFPIQQEARGQPVPRRMRVLASGLQNVAVHRRDERTLIIRPEKGFLSWVFELLFRGEERALALGERIEMTGLTIEITELTADQRPAEVAFRFAVPLEDASLCWLCWQDGVFRPFVPPAVGETIELRPYTDDGG